MAENQALFLTTPDGPFEVRPAPMPTPGPGQLLVRQHATSVNPMDALPGTLLAQVLPWMAFPAILGEDVAGEVVAVGDGVTRFAVGDRVVGHSLGLERERNDQAQNAFQLYVVLEQHMTAELPDSLSYADAAVLPLTLSTASTGLFQPDQLALSLPAHDASAQDAVVVVWGASTSVGTNAVQLAKAAGYRVLATASPRTAAGVEAAGADTVVDRTSATAVDELLALVGEQPLAGVLAIGDGSTAPCIELASRAAGTHRVSSANPPEAMQSMEQAKTVGVTLTPIWGGAIANSHVGAAIWNDFLPGALADGSHRPLPAATVVGDGLEAIPGALEQLRGGVSAAKLVVTL